MNEVVLDASALLALLTDEPGAPKVAEVIGQARMAAENLDEVIGHFQRGMSQFDIDAMLRPLPLVIVPSDEGLERIAERLGAIPELAEMAYGAIRCLALAKRDGLPAVTADKQWRTVADAAEVKLIVIG